MKFVFFFFLLLNCSHTEGTQQQKERFQHIFLRFSFPPFYNSYTKYCCKLYPGGCYRLLDSAGYTCDSLRGRLRQTEANSLVEFEISNVQLGDAGFYRCRVQGTPVYSDYYVEVFEVSSYSEQTPHITQTTTTGAPNGSTALPDSTGPVLAQDSSDSSRASRGLKLPLIAVVSITVMVLVTAVIGAVYCRVKARRKESDMCEETRHESPKPDASEGSDIVYTTVDFTAHRRPEEVYANLQVHKTQARGPGEEHDGTVEYSVLAI